MLKGSAKSPTDDSPRVRRSNTARRVGSETARCVPLVNRVSLPDMFTLSFDHAQTSFSMFELLRPRAS
jgi:hypothetical protein